MIRKLLLLIFLTSSLVAKSSTPIEEKPIIWRESFVQIRYYKEGEADTVIYKYEVTNIGDVPIGTVILGDNPHHLGCQVQAENIKELTTSRPEWTAKMEIQTENPNECIKAHSLNHDYPLEPGKTLTIRVALHRDDPVFENLHWVAIFTRAPTRLDGEVKRGDD